MIELMKEQQQAVAGAEDFIHNSDKKILHIDGQAGTGKSVSMGHLARKYPSAILCAYTGKAASVLRAKTGLDVSTIHSIIYDFKGMFKNEYDEHRHPVFAPKHESDELVGKLVFIDEVSMVGHRIATDLLDTGARLIVTGDGAQLGPVMDIQFFTKPDFTLKEIHRQAWDSPIIRQAHSIRSTGGYVTDGEGFRVLTEMHDDLLTSHDIALCWRNATRIWLNNRCRKILGYGQTLRAGEPVMCLKNDHALKIYNGMIFTLVKDREPGDDLLIRDDLGRDIVILNPTIETVDAHFEQDKHDDAFSPFAISYAATVHKSQGSEWKNVLIIDEYRQAEGRRSFLYTGVTRAIERATVVKRW
jgi:exodeoxyribonuclease-5